MFRHAHSWLDNFVFIFAFEFTFCIYYFIHNTHVTHILSLKKNSLAVRNIGIAKYFLPSICCFLILSMGFFFVFFFYQHIKIQEIKGKNEFTYYKLQRLRWLIRVGNRSKEQKLACCCRSQHKIQWNIFRHVTFTMTSDTIDNRRTTSMLLEVVVGEKVTKTN